MYREYKEYLRQQRTQESIYKGKIQNNDNFDQKVYFNSCYIIVTYLNYIYVYKFDDQDIRPYIKPTTPEIVSTPISNLSLPMASSPNSNVWSKSNTQITKNKLQFTMKREFEKAREEAELVDQLRNVSLYFNSKLSVVCNNY